MGTTSLITLIGICITLVISIINLIVSTKSSNKSIFINSVTKERVNWMSQLRENLSEFIKLTSIYDQKIILSPSDGEEKISNYFDQIIKLNSILKLYLNYRDPEDMEIVKLVEQITNHILDLHRSLTCISDLSKIMSADQINNEYKKDVDSVISYFKKGIIDENELQLICQSLERNKDKNLRFSTPRGPAEQLLVIELIKCDINTLIDKSRIYLKREWDRVKLEAKIGSR